MRRNSVPSELLVRTKPLARRTLPCRSGHGSWVLSQINCGSQGGPCDPCTQKHAGRTPESSLRAGYHTKLRPLRRMPAMLRPEDYDLWLGPSITDSKRAADCLKPFEATLMKKYPVSTRVNRPENDDQECAREISIAESAVRLF
jgi:SOS response associated peptidase (SRAP)